MKNLLPILLFVNLIFTSFAQELPEVPLKNGLAYYKFDHNLENTNNKCLSSYFNVTSGYQNLMVKYISYANQLSQEKTYGEKLFFIKLGGGKLNCIDTMVAQGGMLLWGPVSWTPNIISLSNKKITNYIVSTEIQIVFTSKSAYSIYIKNVQCNLTWANGRGTYIYDLGELYTQVKNSAKISKKDIKFFEELNYFIQATDEIILKSLTETINLDQL